MNLWHDGFCSSTEGRPGGGEGGQMKRTRGVRKEDPGGEPGLDFEVLLPRTLAQKIISKHPFVLGMWPFQASTVKKIKTSKPCSV